MKKKEYMDDSIQLEEKNSNYLKKIYFCVQPNDVILYYIFNSLKSKFEPLNIFNFSHCNSLPH